MVESWPSFDASSSHTAQLSHQRSRHHRRTKPKLHFHHRARRKSGEEKRKMLQQIGWDFFVRRFHRAWWKRIRNDTKRRLNICIGVHCWRSGDEEKSMLQASSPAAVAHIRLWPSRSASLYTQRRCFASPITLKQVEKKCAHKFSPSSFSHSTEPIWSLAVKFERRRHAISYQQRAKWLIKTVNVQIFLIGVELVKDTFGMEMRKKFAKLGHRWAMTRGVLLGTLSNDASDSRSWIQHSR